MTSKVANQSLKDVSHGDQGVYMNKAAEEAARNERIAQGTNRSTFMHLDEKKTQLVSESQSTLLKRQGNSGRSNFSETNRRDQVYISDESVPAPIFPLIESYREKIINISGRKNCALVIDDFFGEAHAILKDTHLKEIARIRNENNVEVMKLKKSLESRLLQEGFTRADAIGSFDKKKGGQRAKDNHAAFKQKDVFADNEAER